MEITGAVLRGGGAAFAIETLHLEEPAADEVLVRLVACGVCHTDLLARELSPEFFAGPCVYGHEGAGVVEAVGTAVTGVAEGDHVVLSFRSCGACRSCTDGHPAYCLRFIELNMFGCRADGTTSLTDATGGRVGSHFFGQSSFATHAVVARDSVVKVDPAFDLTKLAPLGCGVQTGACAVFNAFDVQVGESIVIAGAGTVGLAAIMAAKAAGATTIVALDRHAHRLALARKYGATDTPSVAPNELAGVLREITGVGADYALDTTGNSGVIRGLCDGLGYLGSLGLCGVGFDEVSFDLGSLFSGKTIRTIIEGDAVPAVDIPKLARLNADGKLPYDELIETFSLEAIGEAEPATLSGAVVKPVLVMG